MNSKQYNDYQILKVVEQEAATSQRLISKSTGINVASVNFSMKRLIQKGYIKATNMNKKRIIYHLTPSGIAQKAKLACNFFLRNYHLFSDIREIISYRIDNHPVFEGKNFAIYGLNEITEIVYFCMKEKGVRFAGIYEDSPGLIGEKWSGAKVQDLNELRKNSQVDYVIDAKAAASNILGLSILSPENFIKSKAQDTSDNQSAMNKPSSDFQLKLLGAADSVTGSCILLKAGGKNILIDCGIFQGSESTGKNAKFPFNPKDINYLLLTHAHIDHSGRIPQLIDRGFKGEILCHHATADLLPLMLEDSFKLNGKIKYKLGPEKLMERVIELVWGFEYNRWNQVCKGIRFRLIDAGHILGSATIQFDLEGEYIVFSGDIGNKNTGIIRDPMAPDRADVLVMESTYGGENHSEQDRKAVFKEALKKALEDNGKVLIPSFAIGRTQEIIYQLNNLVEKGELADIPVFIDTPMGVKATELYHKHKECFDDETLRRLRDKDDPLEFDNLFAVEHYRDSILVDDLKGPAIIIAGSGMCSGGRIVGHIANLIEDETTDIIFVGYQAPGTLGADILKYSELDNGYVEIDGKKVFIKAGVRKINGFSAHADQEGLINWVREIKNKPHTIYLNHGEPETQRKLKACLNRNFENIRVVGGYEKSQ